MAHLIIQHSGAYNLYSTVVDSPIYEESLTLDELTEAIWEESGQEGLRDLSKRLDRAHATGCSSAIGVTLLDCINSNHAGEGGTKITHDEFIRHYLTPRG